VQQGIAVGQGARYTRHIASIALPNVPEQEMAQPAVKRGVVLGVVVVLVGGVALAVYYGIKHTAAPTPLATATGPAPAPSKYPLAAPPLRLRAETWDLGTTLPSQESTHSLDLPNSSEQTWTLKHITSTCSCATAELSAKTIRPGDTGKLTLRYRAPAQEGTVSGHVLVEFAERNSPVLQLVIEGRVRALLSADPPKAVLDQPPAGSRTSRIVTLRNFAEQSVTLTGVDAPEWLETQLRPVDVERLPASDSGNDPKPRQAWQLILHADPSKLPGAIGSANVTVRSDSEQVGSAVVAVSLKPPLEANPDYLTFNTAEARKNGLKVALRVAPALGELTEKDVLLTHELGDELKMEVRKESPHLFILLVRLQPKRASVVPEGDLEIRVDKPAVLPVRVHIAGGAPGP
jgi:hypothetical protein